MGMFDTVHNIDGTTWQTKAWYNILDNYFIDNQAPTIGDYSTYALECIGEEKDTNQNEENYLSLQNIQQHNFVYKFILVENVIIIDIVEKDKVPDYIPMFDMYGDKYIEDK